MTGIVNTRSTTRGVPWIERGISGGIDHGRAKDPLMNNPSARAPSSHKATGHSLPRQVLMMLVALAAVTTLISIWGDISLLSPPPSKVLPLSTSSGDYIRGEFLVKFNPDISLDSIREFNRNLGVEELEYIAAIGVFRLKVLAGYSVPQMVQRYETSPIVEYAEPNYVAQTEPTPEGTATP